MRRQFLLAILCGLTLLRPIWAWTDSTIEKETVESIERNSTMTIKGRIKGLQTADYAVKGHAGQTITIDFKPTNTAAYVNLLPPKAVEAALSSSNSGNRFTGTLHQTGTHTIRVSLTESAARRNEAATFDLEVRLSGKETHSDQTRGDAATKSPLSKTFEMQGIRFEITCANQGSQNELHLVPSGLERDNAPIFRSIDGTVTGAEVADLNADGSPEIYVYVTSAGSGSYGSLVAYAANRKKSLSEIYLPPLSEDKKAAQGYMGHDQFMVLEGVLDRRFPIYRSEDTNAAPTGGTRRLQYRLVPGEAGWMLKLHKVVEF